MVKMKPHPTLGIMVRSDGMVLIPGYYFGKDKKVYKPDHWTKGCLWASGYKMVAYKKKRYQVHRLVAETFLPNPDKLPFVDHIDRNKDNNDISNLRWVTTLENNYNKTTTLPIGERKCDLDRVEYNRRIARNYYYRKKKLKEATCV